MLTSCLLARLTRASLLYLDALCLLLHFHLSSGSVDEEDTEIFGNISVPQLAAESRRCCPPDGHRSYPRCHRVHAYTGISRTRRVALYLN